MIKRRRRARIWAPSAPDRSIGNNGSTSNRYGAHRQGINGAQGRLWPDAATIATALGGRRSGQGFAACCPAHDDHNPSLSITDADNGRVLVHCHAGCTQSDVIAELRKMGLWGGSDRVTSASRPIVVHSDTIDVRTAKHREFALSIWEASQHASETAVEEYLRSRRLKLPAHGSMKIPPCAEASVWQLLSRNGCKNHPRH